ncbi:MAG: rhomboid family intramembrane serine protease [Bdellovibrionota bacterium]
MYGREPIGRRPSFGRGDAPPEIVGIVAAVFVLFVFQFFDFTGPIPAFLRLTPAVVESGQLWRLVTYAFVGLGGPNLWFLIELIILFWFGRDVRRALGRDRFWKLLAVGVLGASVPAVLAYWVGLGAESYTPFLLIQGQRAIMACWITAFAVLNGTATIYLFFVLPVQAKWFVPLTIVLGFFGFLSTRDLAGFIGVCGGVASSWVYLRPGGPRRALKEWRLKWKRRRMQKELERLKGERGLHVVNRDDEPPPGGWVN